MELIKEEYEFLITKYKNKFIVYEHCKRIEDICLDPLRYNCSNFKVVRSI